MNHQTKVIILYAKPAKPSNQNKHVEHDHCKEQIQAPLSVHCFSQKNINFEILLVTPRQVDQGVVGRTPRTELH